MGHTSPLRYNDGLPARVWRHGCVQLVQSLSIMPAGLHPRSRLQGASLSRVASVCYVPVFDPRLASGGRCGAVAVLELFTSSGATEAMLLADVLSFVSTR
ncbi:hypothetical protein FOA52_004523 [Chlamydomonas sp. UWO 241]|nr:hypothetical protein FOA52_004523 [Chlamydomonas sp. UWO 241]